jgi:hypothetical protein
MEEGMVMVQELLFAIRVSDAHVLFNISDEGGMGVRGEMFTQEQDFHLSDLPDQS